MSAERSTPLPCVVGIHCSAALVVGADHDFGLIAVALAADRRARLVIAPETALQLALDLVATVNRLRRPPEGQPMKWALIAVVIHAVAVQDNSINLTIETDGVAWFADLDSCAAQTESFVTAVGRTEWRFCIPIDPKARP